LDDEERNSDASFLDVEEDYSSEQNGIVSTSTDGDLRNKNAIGSNSVDIFQSQLSGSNPIKASSSGSTEVNSNGSRTPSPVIPNHGQSKRNSPGKNAQQGQKKRYK